MNYFLNMDCLGAALDQHCPPEPAAAPRQREEATL
jgi:hypothetical protein